LRQKRLWLLQPCFLHGVFCDHHIQQEQQAQKNQLRRFLNYRQPSLCFAKYYQYRNQYRQPKTFQTLVIEELHIQ
jgi:hypothetical protein